ncbi:hypothetical protein BDR26DRAFT_1006305 [Obelidium mucronatum]|nr:hypothetical protein BDR26DRAFT_1006305 [Obelidium mucronatum]
MASQTSQTPLIAGPESEQPAMYPQHNYPQAHAAPYAAAGDAQPRNPYGYQPQSPPQTPPPPAAAAAYASAFGVPAAGAGDIYARLDSHAAAQAKDLPALPLDARAGRQQRSALEKAAACCLPKKRKHRIVCGIATLAAVILLAVLLGLFIPRYPEIKVYAIDLTNLNATNTPYLFTFKNPNNRNFNELRMQMNLTMHVGTYNPNLYDLNVDHIELTSYMMANTSVLENIRLTSNLSSFGPLVGVVGPPPVRTIPNYVPSSSAKIGTSTYGQIVFPSKQWVNYTMIFQLDYTPDAQVGILADPTIQEIANACGITARNGKSRSMKIHYTAASTISSLKAIGFTPELSGDLGIVCPFSQSQITAVVNKVQAGQDAFAAIQDVFGGGDASAPVPPPITINPPADPVIPVPTNESDNSGVVPTSSQNWWDNQPNQSTETFGPASPTSFIDSPTSTESIQVVSTTTAKPTTDAPVQTVTTQVVTATATNIAPLAST